ncbi:MAG: sugar ABC transporter substrate-binding protein [Patulibacter sp.]|nr:sugar ABC transporter substrate-binding protein [Patulibacter sp.]
MFKATRRRLATAAALALTVGGLAACGSDSDDGTTSTAAAGGGAGVEKRTIGYVDNLHSGPMQQRWFNYFTAATDKLGWDVRLQDAKGDAALGAKQGVNLVNQGVDALVISCFDTAPMRPAINAAKKKDIPVLSVGCPLPEQEAWDAVYHQDDNALSTTLAEYVESQAPPSGGKIGVLYDDQLLSGRLRNDVFEATMKDSDTEIVGSEAVGLTDIESRARKASNAFLSANPDLTGIVAIYDIYAPPAVSAIKAAKRTDDVSVYAYYANANNLPPLIDEQSPLQALVDGPVEQVSLVAVDQLLSHFEKGTPLDPKAADALDVNYDIYTKDDHPELTEDYITPYPVDEYLAPYVEKWQQEYGL